MYPHYAIRAGAAACVHVLVNHGAGMQFREVNLLAIDSNSAFFQDVNLSAKNGNTALHVAAVNGQLETLRALIDSGANVNAANDEGQTPIHDASINGRYVIFLFGLSLSLLSLSSLSLFSLSLSLSLSLSICSHT